MILRISALITGALLLAACDASAPSPAPALGAGDTHAAAPAAANADPIALLARAERAMAALQSYEQHVYALEPADDTTADGSPVWQLWDVDYRHESPDRLRMVVRTAVVGEHGVSRHPHETLRIGERTWSRERPGDSEDAWRCEEAGHTAEMPVFVLRPRPGEVAQHLGVERLRGRPVHVLHVRRDAAAADAMATALPRGPLPWTPSAQDSRYWLDDETGRVLRIETDTQPEERLARTEVRTYDAFDSAPQIEAPEGCDPAGLAGSTANG